MAAYAINLKLLFWHITASIKLVKSQQLMNETRHDTIAVDRTHRSYRCMGSNPFILWGKWVNHWLSYALVTMLRRKQDPIDTMHLLNACMQIDLHWRTAGMLPHLGTMFTNNCCDNFYKTARVLWRISLTFMTLALASLFIVGIYLKFAYLVSLICENIQEHRMSWNENFCLASAHIVTTQEIR